MAEPPKRTLTVMAEGRRFMRTARTLPPDEFATLVDDFQRLLQGVLEEHGGRQCVVDGDTAAAEFRDPRQAVAAGLATRAAVAGHQWPSGLDVSVSIGIDPAAKTCALLCDVAEGGQIFLSQATAALLEKDDLGELSMRDLGELPTRRTGDLVRVFELVRP